MGRTAGNRYPRSATPQLPAIDPAKLEPIDVPTDMLMPPNREAMTWQQEKDFARKPHKAYSSRPQWEKLVYETTPEAAEGAENTWSAQQAEFSSSLAPKRPRSIPRTWAATKSPSPQHPVPAALAKAPHPANVNDESRFSGPPRKRSSHKKRRPKDANMTGLRKEAYVPPHLRNQKVDSKPVANGSPDCSQQSKATVPVKHHPTPDKIGSPLETPLSPPTTPQESRDCEQQESPTPKAAYDGWDEPKPLLPPAAKTTKNPRWPNGPQPYKKTIWPKNKDMKYILSSSDTEGGVSFKSNSNGDPDYDIKKLLDWNGDWLPAPESWTARKGHTDRHFGQHIEQWMNGQAQECAKPLYFPPDTFNPVGRACKELAPRYWLEAKVESGSLRESWKTISDSHPKPLEDSDPTDYTPWWELYEDVVYTELVQEEGQVEKQLKQTSCYLNALPVPEARIDFADPEYPSVAWQLASAEEKVQDKIKRTEEKQRRMLAKRNRPVPESKFPIPTTEDRRLRPQANIYIRPVQPADVPGIAEIYNYYVEHTIYATEFDGRTQAQMTKRIADITRAGLPYLVAISKSNQSRNTPGHVSEKIVGYINLDDYCDQSSLFRYTFEMELFVHPGFTSKGIGKCLMDRLLEMADTSYRARGGYEYVNNYEYLKTGPSRVIKTILLNVHHENGGDAENGWQGQFLNSCKFMRVGRLPKVGHKHDKVVDVAIYAHHTKEDIDPSLRPTVAG